MRATGSAQAASVSAAVRYARILKAFSPLISSRSAISAKTCATCRLSTDEPVPFDAVLEHAGAASGQRVANRFTSLRWAVAEEAPAASRAAHLGGGGAGLLGARNQIIDRRRRHPGRQLLARVPFVGNRVADAVPVLPRDGVSHGGGRVADPLEAPEHVAVSVDVLLGDL